MRGQTPIGGIFPMTPDMKGVPPHWGIYFQVADCDKTVAQATSLGGKVFVPPTDIPKTGRFSVLQDPQGAVFTVIKLDIQPG
jgi:predicted enzyme related to lactoylglutathione lyase